jgi:hypothetical protein
MKKLLIKYKILKRKTLRYILQGIANSLWASLNKENIDKDEFDSLIKVGYTLSDYAILKGIRLL